MLIDIVEGAYYYCQNSVPDVMGIRLTVALTGVRAFSDFPVK